MAFSSGSSSSTADINVTPLIDVLLVLLIIFMVLVPVVPRGLDSTVPQEHAKALAAQFAPLTLQVRASSGDHELRYKLNGQEATIAQLQPLLRQNLESREDHTLFVQGERALSYGQVAEALGEARAAGASPSVSYHRAVHSQM